MIGLPELRAPPRRPHRRIRRQQHPHLRVGRNDGGDVAPLDDNAVLLARVDELPEPGVDRLPHRHDPRDAAHGRRDPRLADALRHVVRADPHSRARGVERDVDRGILPHGRDRVGVGGVTPRVERMPRDRAVHAPVSR